MHSSDALLDVSMLAGDAVISDLGPTTRRPEIFVGTRDDPRVLRSAFAPYGCGVVVLSFSDLLLATAPSQHETWAERARRSAVPVPDPEGYAVTLVADLPAQLHQEDIEALRTELVRMQTTVVRNGLRMSHFGPNAGGRRRRIRTATCAWR
jgi:hypothetical protein